jgi:zinc protease
LLLTILANPCQAKLFELTEFILPNRMRVIVVPNHKAPIAKHMVWYKVGSADEELGKGGSAHLLEHLMFRGTKSIKDKEYNRILHKNGAESNAFTSQNFTVYHQTVDISRLELAMYLEADRMKNLVVKPEAFGTERDIVFQERKQVVENDPLAPFFETLGRTLWQEHPYARPVTGTEEEIMSLKIEDVKDIYSKFYVPNNAILIISGDIKPDVAYNLALKYYGNIETKEIEKQTVFPNVLQNTKSCIEMQLPQVEISRLIRSYLVPSFSTQKDKIYAYMVLSAYLGERETSELYKELVLEKKAAAAVFTNYDYVSRSYGNFYIAVVPQNDKKTEDLKSALDEAIHKSIKNINIKKIEIIKNKMLAGLIYLKDDPNNAAYIVGNLASIGMTKEEIENYADMIKKVTAEDVKKAADELFNKSTMIEGVAESFKEVVDE